MSVTKFHTQTQQNQDDIALYHNIYSFVNESWKPKGTTQNITSVP